MGKSVKVETRALAVDVGGSVGDFIALMKPRVMSLVVFTAIVGLMVAPGQLHPVLAVIALIAIAVGAGAAGALNMWYDADIDARMARTAARPIPRGYVTKEEALAFGVVLSIFSVMTLGLLVNWVAGLLLAITIGYYIFIYTMWLKRRTPQNIVIGGAAGAFPPMIGWAAVTGTVSLESILLFLIIFFWTPPHFWALALFRSKTRDYAAAGVPMYPAVYGDAKTRQQIFIYTLLLVITSLLLVFPLQANGLLYFGIAAVLGGVFVHKAVLLLRRPAQQPLLARSLFMYSNYYLALLFLAMVVDRLVLA